MNSIYTACAIAGAMWLSPSVATAPEKAVTLHGSIRPHAKAPDQCTVTVQFDIQKGWHTYDDAGEGAEAATTLAMKLPEGAQGLGEWSRPFAMDGHATGSFIHEGKVEFSRNVAVTAAARGKEIAVTVQYQACTDEYCNPPQTKVLSVLIPEAGQDAAGVFDAPVRVQAQGKLLNEDGKVRFLSPALHDVDGDGRSELVLGSLMGRVTMHRDLNTTGKGDPVWGPRENFVGATGEPIRTSNW